VGISDIDIPRSANIQNTVAIAVLAALLPAFQQKYQPLQQSHQASLS